MFEFIYMNLLFRFISPVMVRKFCKTNRVCQRNLRERKNLLCNKGDFEGNILTNDL